MHVRRWLPDLRVAPASLDLVLLVRDMAMPTDEVVALRDAMGAQSWEPGLVDKCYSKLAAAPAKGRARIRTQIRPLPIVAEAASTTTSSR